MVGFGFVFALPCFATVAIVVIGHALLVARVRNDPARCVRGRFMHWFAIAGFVCGVLAPLVLGDLVRRELSRACSAAGVPWDRVSVWFKVWSGLLWLVGLVVGLAVGNVVGRVVWQRLEREDVEVDS